MRQDLSIDQLFPGILSRGELSYLYYIIYTYIHDTNEIEICTYGV